MKKVLCAAAGILLSVSVFAASGDEFTIDLQADNLQAVGADLQSAFEQQKKAPQVTEVAQEKTEKEDAEAAFKNAEKALDILIKNNPESADYLKIIQNRHQLLYRDLSGDTIKKIGSNNAGQMMFMDVTELVETVGGLKGDLAKQTAKILDHQYWNNLSQSSHNVISTYWLSLSYANIFVNEKFNTQSLFSEELKYGVNSAWNSYISLWLNEYSKPKKKFND